MRNQTRDMVKELQRDLPHALRMAKGAIDGLDVAKPEFAREWARTVFEKLKNVASDPGLPEGKCEQLRTYAERWKQFTAQWEGQPNKDELSKALTILEGEKTKLEAALAEILKATE